MLGKLFKHEFRAMSRVMLPVTAALVVLAGLSNFSIRFIDNVKSDFLAFLLGLFIVLFVIGMAAAGIMLIVVVVSRFYNNYLKDEGYLMFTLPVNAHELVWSKLLVSLLWTVITALVIYGLIMLTALNAVSMSSEAFWLEFKFDLNGLLRYLSDQLDITGGDLALLIIEGVLLCVLGIFSGYLHFYTAMSIGQSFANHKVLMSVVFYLAISFVVQIISPFFVTWMADAFIPDRIQYARGVTAVEIGLLITCGIELVYGAILYVTSTQFLKRKLNLG